LPVCPYVNGAEQAGLAKTIIRALCLAPAEKFRQTPAGARSRARPTAGAKEIVVEQRVSLITLGVRDLDRARAFYEGMGWTSAAAQADDVVFFQAGGMVLALWDRAQLAEDSGQEDPGGWGGVTLACNVRAPAEVEAVIEQARAAGARIARAGADTFWGGYSGVFADPDGHTWEVAHNPHWKISPSGDITLP